MNNPNLDTLASEQLDTHLEQVEDRLSRDYSSVPRPRLHDLVSSERARFNDARVHAFVPILVERAVRTTLTTPPGKHQRT
ncbi:three-helix bundle dimerization domain-containing protein [Amycolatopsis sp. NPDC004378]